MKLPNLSIPIIRKSISAEAEFNNAISPSAGQCGCPNECLGTCADGVCLGPCV